MPLPRSAIERSFIIDRNNDIVFFPYGSWGPGYVLRSEDQKNKIILFTNINLTLFLGLSLGGILALKIGVIPFVLFCVVYLVVHYLILFWMLRGCPKSDEKLISPLGQHLRNASGIYTTRGKKIKLLLSALFFLVIGIALLLTRDWFLG